MTSARQLAGTMRLSGAMVRKYAQAYEEITGDRIAIIGRDGRQFDNAQREALILARGFVEENPGMSVDMAMRAALGRAEIAAKRPDNEQGIDMLVEALGKVAAPLQAELEGIRLALAELPELRREVSSLRREIVEQRAISPVKASRPPDPYPKGYGAAVKVEENPDKEIDRDRESRDGFLVRAARRLERMLRK